MSHPTNQAVLENMRADYEFWEGLLKNEKDSHKKDIIRSRMKKIYQRANKLQGNG